MFGVCWLTVAVVCFVTSIVVWYVVYAVCCLLLCDVYDGCVLRVVRFKLCWLLCVFVVWWLLYVAWCVLFVVYRLLRVVDV